MNLRSLNTHAVANGGAAVGGTAVIAAISAFFGLVSNPAWLAAFFLEIEDRVFGPHCLQLTAAFFAIVGAIVVALVATYFGRPPTIPADAPPQAPT